MLAGPSTGTLLAELGARVIKIENPVQGGDVTRSWKNAKEDSNSPVSAYYASANGAKEVLNLNLANPKALKQIHGLIAQADILITSFKPGSDKKLGFHPAAVFQLNPKIIYSRITGYGYKDSRPAYDLVIQAESGFMSMNGAENGPPLRMPVALMDILAAHQLKTGILTALLACQKSDKGCIVEVSLLDAALSSLANQAGNYLNTGLIPTKMGSLHPNIAPYGELMQCADDVVLVLAVGSDTQFNTLCHQINRPELVEDNRFKQNPDRVKHRTALFELILPAFRTRKGTEWKARLQAVGVPCGLVKNLEEVFSEPAAQNMVIEEEIEGQIMRRTKQQAFRIIAPDL